MNYQAELELEETRRMALRGTAFAAEEIHQANIRQVANHPDLISTCTKDQPNLFRAQLNFELILGRTK